MASGRAAAGRAVGKRGSAEGPLNIAGARLAGLGNRFVELFGRRLSREEFAAQVAALTAEAIKGRAVVVLGYDRRRDRLAVLADHGLHDEGRAALGGDGFCPWDIPLRGLKNRRISVIEAAHQNPFVPRGLITLTQTGLSIASLPVYYEQEPVAVLLLLAGGSRAFSDTQLQTLSQALRVCARGLREPDGSGTAQGASSRAAETVAATAAPAPAPDPPATAIDPAQENRQAEPPLRLVSARKAPESERDALIALLEEEIGKLRAELESRAKTIDTLTLSGTTMARQHDELAQQLKDVGRTHHTETAELRSQISALQERAQAADSERARLQGLLEEQSRASQLSISVLETDRTDALERARAADTENAALCARLAVLDAERDQLAAHVQTSQQELERVEAQHAGERAALQADRDHWQQETASLGRQLAQQAEQIATRDRELGDLTAARDAATAELRAAQERSDRLRALAEDLQNAVTELETARAAAAVEVSTLQGVLAAERSQHSENDEELHAQLAAAHAAAEQLWSAVALAHDEAIARTCALSERDDQLTTLHKEIKALQQQRTEREVLEQQATELRQRVAEVEQLLVQVQNEAAAADGERAALAVRLEETLQREAAARTEGTEQLQRAVQAEVEQAERLESECRRAALLTDQCAQLQQSLATTEERRAQLEAALEPALTEIEALRQHIADRGALAHQATQLGCKVTELEETLVARSNELEAQRAAVADLQATLERIRGGRVQTEEAMEAAAQRLAESQRDNRQLSAQLEQYNASTEAAAADRQRLSAQVGHLTSQLRASQAALEVAEGRSALERTTIEAERDRWQREAAAAHAEATSLAATIAELQHVATDTEAVCAQAKQEHAALQRTVDDERTHWAETEQALQHDMALLRADAQRLAEDTATLRQKVAERDEELAELRREQERARLAEAASQETAARLRAEIAASEARLNANAAEQQCLRNEGERADRQLALASEAHAAETQALTQTLQAAHERITQLEEERGSLRAALADLRSRLEKSQGAADTQRDALHGELAEAHTQLEALRERSADRDCLARQTNELDNQVAALEQQLAALRTESQQTEHHRAALAEELDATRRLQAEAQARADGERATIQAAVERLTGECTRLEAEKTALTTELQAQCAASLQLQQALEQARAREEQKPKKPAGRQKDRGKETPLVIERSAPLDAIVEPDPGAVEAQPPAQEITSVRSEAEGQAMPTAGEMVLLDSGPLREGAGVALKSAGFEMSFADPIEGVADDLARRKLTCVLLNLGNGAAAWRLLKILREHAGTQSVPILAYVMTPEASTGFCFGRADFVPWPMEPARLVERLNSLRPKAKRLLAVSSDIDAMNQLRELLARGGVSTSIALDEKQAAEFAPLVQPEAVILHLSPKCASVARAIAMFRSREATRDLPLLILLDQPGSGTEEAFFNATNRQLLRKGTFEFTCLPDQIARLVSASMS